jgi:peroxiredoxin
LPSLQNLETRFKDKPFRVVMVNAGDSPEAVRSFIAGRKYTFDVLLDSRGIASSAYRVRAHPAKFLIDKNGKLVFSVLGYREWDGPEAIEFFQRIIAEP